MDQSAILKFIAGRLSQPLTEAESELLHALIRNSIGPKQIHPNLPKRRRSQIAFYFSSLHHIAEEPEEEVPEGHLERARSCSRTMSIGSAKQFRGKEPQMQMIRNV